MSHKLPVADVKWDEDVSEYNEDFIKSYNDESDEGYFLKGDVQYSENLHNFHNNLLFLSERMKIEKVEKLVTNLHGQTEYVIHIKKLKQELKHRLALPRVYGIIKFNQETWLKSYNDKNTDLRKKAKNDFKKSSSQKKKKVFSIRTKL